MFCVWGIVMASAQIGTLTTRLLPPSAAGAAAAGLGPGADDTPGFPFATAYQMYIDWILLITMCMSLTLLVVFAAALLVLLVPARLVRYIKRQQGDRTDPSVLRRHQLPSLLGGTMSTVNWYWKACRAFTAAFSVTLLTSSIGMLLAGAFCPERPYPSERQRTLFWLAETASSGVGFGLVAIATSMRVRMRLHLWNWPALPGRTYSLRVLKGSPPDSSPQVPRSTLGHRRARPSQQLKGAPPGSGPQFPQYNSGHRLQ